MNRFTAVAVLIAVSMVILTPVGFAVNTPSVNTRILCSDGSGSPVPPVPVLLTDGSGSPVPPVPVLQADGSGSPVPPVPVLFEDRGNMVSLIDASARG
jgi:hypothetical protein